MSKSHNHY